MDALKKGALLGFVAVLGLGLSACDSKRENAAEDQAEAVRNSADATADAIDQSASQMGGTAEAQMKNTADAIRESGEAKADAMEDAADRNGR